MRTRLKSYDFHIIFGKTENGKYWVKILTRVIVQDKIGKVDGYDIEEIFECQDEVLKDNLHIMENSWNLEKKNHKCITLKKLPSL